MRVYFAADHAGFELKNILIAYVQQLGHETEDCGAFELEPNDDYPQIVASAARQLSDDWAGGLESRAILIGASGQGEAMVANRFKGVRAAVYYGGSETQTDAAGKTLDMISSVREHNNANALALGARFLSPENAKKAVQRWLEVTFSNDERHIRRVTHIDMQR